MTTHTGGCLCGNVRYEFDAEPLMTANCFCRDCQQVTGSPMTTVCGLPETAFRLLQGDLGEYTVTGSSGKAVTRQFCTQCGSALFTRGEVAPGIFFVKATSLDDPSWVNPDTNVFTSAAQPWAHVSELANNFPQNPPV